MPKKYLLKQLGYRLIKIMRAFSKQNKTEETSLYRQQMRSRISPRKSMMYIVIFAMNSTFSVKFSLKFIHCLVVSSRLFGFYSQDASLNMASKIIEAVFMEWMAQARFYRNLFCLSLTSALSFLFLLKYIYFK